MATTDNVKDYVSSIANVLRNKLNTDRLINPQEFYNLILQLGNMSDDSEYDIHTLKQHLEHWANGIRKVKGVDTLINPQDFHFYIESILPTIKMVEGQAGDVVCYDTLSQKVVLISMNDYLNGENLVEYYEPIGVVVVPNSHTSDNTIRCISLKPMNCDTPFDGGEFQCMTWGVKENMSTLTNYNTYPYASSPYSTTASTKSIGTYTAGGDNLYCSFEHAFRYTTEYNENNKTTLYYTTQYTGTEKVHAPIPYLSDGISKNEAYHTGCLVDMDGKSNTEKIIDARGSKDYSSWKPTAIGALEDYPAASCCNMYQTKGTSQGEWYLPSIGELCYLIPYIKRINTMLGFCGGVPFGDSTSTKGDLFLWSSTESSTSGAVWRLNVYDSGFYSSVKTSTIFGAYAFISLKLG